ncbi:MAG: GGDEF domain-containing protein [Gammaproteobacteria bacterium]|nr:GGDEF domain-containing protein [Gammaproteobacteria bacterium]MDH5651987.1 GGDEF domain-containing protein [Gammaproteobacteria bacterium]
MQSSDRFTIGWCSNEPLPEDCDFAHFIPRPVNAQEQTAEMQVDAYVFDQRAFTDINALQQACLTYRPALVLVAGEEEEVAFLDALGIHGDVCRYPLSDAQLYRRLHRICHLANVDALTGLTGRKEFQRSMESLEDGNTGAVSVSLLFINMDKFKFLNDSFGHLAGDTVLREVAVLIRQHFINAGNISRLSGDEFTVLLEQDSAGAMQAAELFRQQVARHGFSCKTDITVSIGVSTYHPAAGYAEFVQHANEALYAAKAGGRNSVVCYDTLKDMASAKGDDVETRNFENLTRVLSERASNLIARRGRKILDSMRSEAERDGLTGVYNRKYFNNRFQREFDLARKNNRAFSIALLDIDFFGRFNKAYGVLIGDKVLKTLCDAVQKNIRTVDWFARYGGEEFCLVMTDTDRHNAFEVTQRIHQIIRNLEIGYSEGEMLHITASIGLVTLSETDTGPDAMIQRASKLLNTAKESGRDQICQDDGEQH